MIIRLTTPQGIQRLQTEPNETLLQILQKAQNVDVKGSELWRDAGRTQSLSNLNLTLAFLKISHGDMLYLTNKQEEVKRKVEIEKSVEEYAAGFEEDEIDTQLAKEEGWIRQTDPSKCGRHGPKSQCINCAPLEPWLITRTEPWMSQGVKFIPFHSFLRQRLFAKCNHPSVSSKCPFCQPLEEDSFKPANCNRHPPWPEAVCPACRPSDIKLQKQEYRHVDSVVFDSPDILDDFLNVWRQTGVQRCGFLIGKYVRDDNIPLGIRAQVSAIFTPPQKGTLKSVELLKDPASEQKLDEFLKILNLRRVGFVWTSIEVDATGKALVSRSADTFVLSGAEYLISSFYQNKYKSPLKKSKSGYFGSKFVSVLITGGKDGSIVPMAYQASNQCAWMARDKLMKVSPSNPSVLQLKIGDPKIYIPDVIYHTGGSTLTKKADPDIPTEFFYVEVSNYTPKVPNQLFSSIKFPPENSLIDVPSPQKAGQIIASGKSKLRHFLTDFHLLFFLFKSLPQDKMKVVIEFLDMNPSVSQDQVLAVLDPFVKQAPPPASSSTSSQSKPPAPSSAKTKPAPTPSSAPASNPKELQMRKQLEEMGIPAERAREALFATNYVSVEAALNFLMDIDS
eukprot:TRINITY_DN4684_c0_g1_i1.p1 TRINITY_DN4684_c0_g1~~TRINITY_DN4684_c0_g1_i1.p1  ORF type:complete len:619 (-),score=143.26 TRINITY_DN4684_c0_g1_i1:40-1896(-)